METSPIEPISPKPKAVEMPMFSLLDKEDLKAFHFFMEFYQDEVNEMLRVELMKHPLIGLLMANIPEQVLEANKKRSEQNRVLAILHDNWQPLLEDLHEQATNMAKMGIPYRTWYNIVGMSLRVLESKFESHFGNDLSKALPVIRGMRIFLDFTMCSFAETHIAYIGNLVEQKEHQQEQHVASHRELIYAASHHLQEPLTKVRSLVNAIQEDGENKIGAEVSAYLNYISDSTDRMNSLVSDLLDYSRIGEMSSLSKGNMNDILKLVVDGFIASGRIKPENIKVMPLPSMLMVYPEEIKMVFQQLIANSIQYHAEGRPLLITIGCQKDGEFWVFSVNDNGIGIPEKSFDRIFGIFKRLEQVENQEGTGIGLAICKKVLELHNGKIAVASKVGEGTTINFCIPVFS